MRLVSVVRALRLPFLTASGLPFCLGVLLAPGALRWAPVLLVLLSVLLTHAAANLINDYADRAVDSLDPAYYGFFGGSKLIQTGVLSPLFYRNAAILCSACAFLCVVVAAFCRGQYSIILLYLLVLLLGWSYSAGPLRLVYRGWGELAILLLFGPATVVGGYVVQAARWPDASVWLVSLVAGMLTAAILVANEVPDAPQDAAGGKRTLVVRIGAAQGHMLYAHLNVGAFAGLALLLFMGRIGWISVLAFAALATVATGWQVLQRAYMHKSRLVVASKMAIFSQTWVVLILLVDAWVRRGY